MPPRDYRCEYVVVDTNVWGQDGFIFISSVGAVTIDCPNCRGRVYATLQLNRVTVMEIYIF